MLSVYAVVATLKRGQLGILDSTTYPGTTDEVVQPKLVAKGFTPDVDFFLAFSPERVDPGNPQFNTKNIPKIVGGVGPASTEVAAALYGATVQHVIQVTSTRVAEMVKLLENTFRAVNIGLVNEIALMCHKMNIDVWEVIDAAKTKPFGFMPFYPGPGLGGHCIPIDPFYLSWKARQYDLHTEFIELAGKTNEAMPYYVVQRLMDALNTHRKSLAGSKVLVLGVAYKSNIDDMRESPAIKITELLLDKSADVVYHDPYVASFRVAGRTLESAALTEELLASTDAVVVVTDHSNVDYNVVVRNASLILDTRNALKAFDDDKVVRL